MKLKINSKEFDHFYPMMKDFKDIFVRDWKTDQELINEFLPSKLWRMNNLYTIVDKDGDKIPFKMNRSQHVVYSSYLEHPRLIILKSRQQGISTFWLIFFFDEILFEGDLSEGLMAQGLDESETLLKRIKVAWDELDPAIKDYIGAEIAKDNTKEFSLSNGSTLFVRTSFRSTTLQGLHVSEFGKIANKYPQKAKETQTGSMQAIKPGLPIAIESTAEGDNEFKRMCDQAMENKPPYAGKDFKFVFLSWMDDPDCRSVRHEEYTEEQEQYFLRLEDEVGFRLTTEQRNFWLMQYRELGDHIYQEYPSTPEEAFTASRDGTYYAKQFREKVVNQNRIVSDLYDPNLNVEVTMDLGMSDTYVLGFWQKHGKEERLIDEYINSGEGLAHYVSVMFDKPYRITRVYGPHDLKVRELNTGTSRKARLRELGVRNIKVLPKIAVADGIESVRNMLDNLWIDERCTYIITCFKNYSKEWDDRLGCWKEKPLHNEYSNGMDMVRYRGVAKHMVKSVSKATAAKPKRSRQVTDGLAL